MWMPRLATNLLATCDLCGRVLQPNVGHFRNWTYPD